MYVRAARAYVNGKVRIDRANAREPFAVAIGQYHYAVDARRLLRGDIRRKLVGGVYRAIPLDDRAEFLPPQRRACNGVVHAAIGRCHPPQKVVYARA